MSDKKSNAKSSGIPVFLGIASVWFGAHAGPGVASGKQTAVYFSAFGKWGLITPIIAMGVLALCIYYGIEYARIKGLKNFRQLTDSLFHPYEKLFSTFFEITFIATVLMVIGGCYATGAEILYQYIGLPVGIATIILGAITILLSMYGANLVRASSTFMTIFIILSIGLIVVLGLLSPEADFSGQWETVSFSGAPFGMAAIMAVVYAGFQSAGNIANAVSVSGGLESRKESKKAAITGLILNVLLIEGIALLLFAYPESLVEDLPNYFVVTKVGNPILVFAYVLMVLLAVLSTTVSFTFSVVARYRQYFPIQEERKKDFTITLILTIVTLAVSSVGLDAIVSQGYKYLGYACIPIVIIPTILFGIKKVRESDKLVKG